MSKLFPPKESLNSGQMGPVRFKNQNLNEVHAQPGEVFCFLNSEHFKFKIDFKIDPRIKNVEARPGEGSKVMICIKVEGISGVHHDAGDPSDERSR